MAFTIAAALASAWGCAQSGSLYLSIHRPAQGEHASGRPGAADVVIIGPDGTARHVATSQLLADLPAGTYQVQPRDVSLDGVRFVGMPGATTVTVESGRAETLPITYVDAVASGVHGDPVPSILRPGSRTFHVDCSGGDDGASGRTPTTAIRSLAQAERLELEPGDRLLLRRGCEWQGPFTLRWHGTEEWPIVIGAYGEGSRPAIRDAPMNNVDVFGSYVVVEHLQASTSPGTVWTDPLCRHQPVGWRTGFTIQHEAHHVTLRFVLAYGNTAGAHVTYGAAYNRIVNSEFRDNVIMSVNTNDGGFDDSGAWGIVLNGRDTTIGYNRFSGNVAWCSYDFGVEGASIEIYEGVRTLVHHNLSVDDITFSELGGSQRRRAADATFAFNRFVSDRANAEFLVLRGAGAHFGPTPGTRAFNNTVYLTHPSDTQGVVCYSGCGPDMLELRNNIIWVEWKALFADAPFTESNNLFWRADARPLLQFFGSGNAMDATSMVADPRFVDARMRDLRLSAASPAVGAAAPIDVHFARDAAGEILPGGQPRDLGAYQRPR